ncbi:MAG: trypsin-like serine protease [Gemmatimonadetes bacterium]|nr:trypsin-like serine protease [Gemmatimonadota bacterium]
MRLSGAGRILSRGTQAAILAAALAHTAAAQLPTWSLSTAGNASTPFQAQSMLVGAVGSNTNDPRYSTPRGAGNDGVAGLLITKPSGTFLCTGSLLMSGQDILTAAHCLANSSGVVDATSVQAVFFPNGSSGSFTVTSTSFRVNSLYNGQVINDNDIAIIRLATPITTPGIDRYNIWTGPIPTNNTVNFVGFGLRGSGALGFTAGAGSRRQGLNRFDFFNSPGVLISDFDSGNQLNDASCYFNPGSSFCDLGTGADEVGLGGGDSGGPAFITSGGQRYIAGVASFGATFGLGLVNPFGICVPAGDPRASTDATGCLPGNFLALGPDIDNSLNGTFGEFNGHVSTAYQAGWIMNNTVPEPASFVLVGSGLLGLLGVMRRRKGTR